MRIIILNFNCNFKEFLIFMIYYHAEINNIVKYKRILIILIYLFIILYNNCVVNIMIFVMT